MTQTRASSIERTSLRLLGLGNITKPSWLNAVYFSNRTWTFLAHCLRLPLSWMKHVAVSRILRQEYDFMQQKISSFELFLSMVLATSPPSNQQGIGFQFTFVSHSKTYTHWQHSIIDGWHKRPTQPPAHPRPLKLEFIWQASQKRQPVYLGGGLWLQSCL